MTRRLKKLFQNKAESFHPFADLSHLSDLEPVRRCHVAMRRDLSGASSVIASAFPKEPCGHDSANCALGGRNLLDVHIGPSVGGVSIPGDWKHPHAPLVLEGVPGDGDQVIKRHLSQLLLTEVLLVHWSTQWSVHIPQICNRNRKS